MANSADPDQLPLPVVSDLGLHWLFMPISTDTLSRESTLSKTTCMKVFHYNSHAVADTNSKFNAA